MCRTARRTPHGRAPRPTTKELTTERTALCAHCALPDTHGFDVRDTSRDGHAPSTTTVNTTQAQHTIHHSAQEQMSQTHTFKHGLMAMPVPLVACRRNLSRPLRQAGVAPDDSFDSLSTIRHSMKACTTHSHEGTPDGRKNGRRCALGDAIRRRACSAAHAALRLDCKRRTAVPWPVRLGITLKPSAKRQGCRCGSHKRVQDQAGGPYEIFALPTRRRCRFTVDKRPSSPRQRPPPLSSCGNSRSGRWGRHSSPRRTWPGASWGTASGWAPREPCTKRW